MASDANDLIKFDSFVKNQKDVGRLFKPRVEVEKKMKMNALKQDISPLVHHIYPTKIGPRLS